MVLGPLLSRDNLPVPLEERTRRLWPRAGGLPLYPTLQDPLNIERLSQAFAEAAGAVGSAGSGGPVCGSPVLS